MSNDGLAPKSRFPSAEPKRPGTSSRVPTRALFADVLDYCRESLEDARCLRAPQQRIRRWAAIAILRSLLSSPDAAAMVLGNRAAKVWALPAAAVLRGSQRFARSDRFCRGDRGRWQPRVAALSALPLGLRTARNERLPEGLTFEPDRTLDCDDDPRAGAILGLRGDDGVPSDAPPCLTRAAGTENSGADSHVGGPKADRLLEIGAHAHAEDAEPGAAGDLA
jgi:hypothetical protein